jgi:hypothetical protein
LAEQVGAPGRAYDIFIRDHYFIIWPTALVANVVVFAVATLALMRLVRRA